MHHTWRRSLIVCLIVAPLLGALVPIPPHVSADDAGAPCRGWQEGDYRTRFPNTGGAKFMWRGGNIEASLIFLQDLCSCTGHEEIIDPVTGIVAEGPCNEWRWKEESGFDRTK